MSTTQRSTKSISIKKLREAFLLNDRNDDGRLHHEELHFFGISVFGKGLEYKTYLGMCQYCLEDPDEGLNWDDILKLFSDANTNRPGSQTPSVGNHTPKGGSRTPTGQKSGSATPPPHHPNIRDRGTSRGLASGKGTPSHDGRGMSGTHTETGSGQASNISSSRGSFNGGNKSMMSSSFRGFDHPSNSMLIVANELEYSSGFDHSEYDRRPQYSRPSLPSSMPSSGDIPANMNNKMRLLAAKLESLTDNRAPSIEPKQPTGGLLQGGPPLDLSRNSPMDQGSDFPPARRRRRKSAPEVEFIKLLQKRISSLEKEIRHLRDTHKGTTDDYHTLSVKLEQERQLRRTHEGSLEQKDNEIRRLYGLLTDEKARRRSVERELQAKLGMDSNLLTVKLELARVQRLVDDEREQHRVELAQRDSLIHNLKQQLESVAYERDMIKNRPMSLHVDRLTDLQARLEKLESKDNTARKDVGTAELNFFRSKRFQ